MEMIIRASQNKSFTQIINTVNEKVCRLDKALVNELDENATAQESALTAMADMLSRSKGDVTIYTGENSRIRFLQIAKYLKNGSDTADIADEIESKFTDTMRKLTVGEANAITALAEAIADAMAEERKIVVRNTRQLLHVQLTGDLDELESLVGKQIELINVTDAEGRKIAVVKGHEGIVSENNAFGVGGNRHFTVEKWARGYSFSRTSDPHADKNFSELTDIEKADYKGMSLIRILCDKELKEFLPQSQAVVSETASLEALLAG